MSKFKAMKFWIGNDPKCSERVQKMLFDMGYGWAAIKRKTVSNTDLTCIRTDNYGSIMYASSVVSRENFDSSYGFFSMDEEINIDWLRSPKEETIELNGQTYIKSDVEEALKKLKPVN